jgi:phage I-like protein
MLITNKFKATRRANAVGAISLAKRRTWAIDPPGQGAQNDPVPDGAEDGDVPIDRLPKSWQLEIKKLRAEAAERRVALDRVEAAAREREQKALAEQGNFKAIAEQHAATIAALTPAKERMESLEAMMRAGNEARIGQLPETSRGLVPTDYPPERLSAWLDANWLLLQARRAPDLDAGAGAGGGGSVARLTEDEKAAARRSGMTDEQYSNAKKKQGL